MTTRDRQRLDGVHPQLIKHLESIFDVMDAERKPIFVVQGVRTTQEQARLYAIGRTVKGTIVTNKDGILWRSDHQPHPDGFGHAVDCAFIGPQPFDPRHPWQIYGEECERRGLIWGGRWTAPHDSPHCELPEYPEPLEERTVFST